MLNAEPTEPIIVEEVTDEYEDNEDSAEAENKNETTAEAEKKMKLLQKQKKQEMTLKKQKMSGHKAQKTQVEDILYVQIEMQGLND